MTATIHGDDLSALEADPDVEAVSVDAILYAGAVQAQEPTTAKLENVLVDTLGLTKSRYDGDKVGMTPLSYTYTQPVRADRPYNLYHGTLEARPVTATTSKLVYTLFFDNSMLADDAARERDKANRTTRFTQALENMKILAEGGTLPPAPPTQK